MQIPKITGIILSAGLSSRMKKFKPLLTLDSGETFVQHMISKLAKVCDEVVVVSGHENGKLVKHLSDCTLDANYKIVYNEKYESGMFTSLQSGLKVSQAGWYLYHFIDQPSLPIEFYKELIKFIETEYNWIQPVNEMGKGHPILFDSLVKDIILENNEGSNLREVNKDSRIVKKYWEYKSKLIFQDIDNPEDYSNIQ